MGKIPNKTLLKIILIQGKVNPAWFGQEARFIGHRVTVTLEWSSYVY